MKSVITNITNLKYLKYLQKTVMEDENYTLKMKVIKKAWVLKEELLL